MIGPTVVHGDRQHAPGGPKCDVLLASMPFGPHILQPSMGLSLLKACVDPLSVHTSVVYFTLRYARRSGVDLYADIGYSEPTIHGFAGEWLFNGCLFPDHELDTDAYVEEILRGRSTEFREARHNIRPMDEDVIARILDLRAQSEAFIDECAEEVVSRGPRIVGLTSTFQQHVASLALARRLKERDPRLFVVLGGANCEGVMGWETKRRFPFVDAVVSGEAEAVFPALVEAVLEGRELPEMPGLFLDRHMELTGADRDRVAHRTGPSVEDLDTLPYPGYDDFFEQFEEAALDFGPSEEAGRPRIMFETSRGCWWGDKSHCAFCGLNGSNIRYRSKSSERALAELQFLVERHPGCSVSVVDNILDMSYFKSFVPHLAALDLGVELFYEIKANLSKDQVRLLRDAGIARIQPGIENLNSHVLSLMHKGIRSIQNVQLLKWCKEFGVKPYWNMLYGLPGEEAEDYAEVAEAIPFLTHFQPPTGGGIIRLDRFSPNFQNAQSLGFIDVAPYPAYFHIYDLPREAVFNLAYFFTYDYADGRDVQSYVAPVTKRLRRWQEVHTESDLFSVDKEDHLLVWDLRPDARQPLYILSGLVRELYLACDQICGFQPLAKVIRRSTGKEVPPEELQRILDQLVARGLLYREGSSYLGLAVPLGDYSPSAGVLAKLRQTIAAMGEAAGERVAIAHIPEQRKEVVATA